MSSELTPAQRLTLILEGLRKEAAARASKNWLLSPVVMILWNYLARIMARFDALTARLRNGIAARKPALRAARIVSDAPRKPRLPRSWGWLAAFGWQTRGYGGQLRHLLCDPGMQAMMADSPQIARLLRPLCRMLAIEPAPDLPPSLYPARPAKPGRVERPAVARAAGLTSLRPSAPFRPRPAARPRCDREDWWMPKRV